MNNAVIIPLTMVIISGLALQLHSLAESSSEKAVTMATDAENAIDCATRGIPISQCSPNLLDTSGIRKDLETFKEINERLISENITKTTLVINEGESIILHLHNDTYKATIRETHPSVEEVAFAIQKSNGKDDLLTLGIHKEKEIDIDNDGIADARIEIQKITYTGALIYIEVLNKNVVPLEISATMLIFANIILVVIWIKKHES